MLSLKELSEWLKQFNISHTVTDSQCYDLYKAACNCKEGVIVELGCGHGKSTLSLGLGANVTVYSVDAFIVPGCRDIFEANIVKAGFTGKVVSIHAMTNVAAKTFTLPIGLMFIDADHSYSSVKIDFENWYSKIMVGGLMIMHDYTKPHPGLIGYVDEIAFPKDIINQMVYIHF